MNVEDQRARSVRDVGDMHATSRQLPDEPGVDGTEREPRGFDADVVEKPPNLRRRKIRIEDETGSLAEQRLVFAQFVAEWRGAPMLPDDGARNRLPGVSTPRGGRSSLFR